MKSTARAARRAMGLGMFTVAMALSIASTGCLNIKAPERIDIGGSRREPIDSSRVPPTASHEEARRELGKAYAEIQRLERKNEGLRRDAEKYRQERDDCRRGQRD